jgi:hypothetical protein
MAAPGQLWQNFSNLNLGQVQPLCACSFAIYLKNVEPPGRAGINHEQRKSLVGSPGQPWQITGPVPIRQAKCNQYLQDAKNPMSISQTEKAVEREQIPSNEEVLPTPDLDGKNSSHNLALF